jgi:hypothetical protein
LVALVAAGTHSGIVSPEPPNSLADAGVIVIPIIIYHHLQPRGGAWLARRHALVEQPEGDCKWRAASPLLALSRRQLPAVASIAAVHSAD